MPRGITAHVKGGAGRNVSRSLNDYYPTEFNLAYACISKFFTLSYMTRFKDFENRFNVLDVGAGMGVWGMALRKYINEDKKLLRFVYGANKETSIGIDGIDIDKQFESYSDGYDKYYITDYQYLVPDKKYHMIIGNPPFNDGSHAPEPMLWEKFVHKSWHMLEDGGFIGFLLPIDFLASDRREDFYTQYPLLHVSFCRRRPHFINMRNGVKNNTTNYAFFMWVKGRTIQTFSADFFTYERE